MLQDPSLRSGFRLRAPAALTPARRLKFESLRARQLLPDPSLRSGFRLRAPASLTPARRLKFDSLRAHHSTYRRLRTKFLSFVPFVSTGSNQTTHMEALIEERHRLSLGTLVCRFLP